MLFRGQKGLMQIEGVVTAFQQFADEFPDSRMFLWVGTDSQQHGLATRFVTSITAYRQTKGAQSYQYVKQVNRILSLSEKLDYETHMSIEVIGELRRILNMRILFWELELHIDCGENGKSGQYLNRVVGWAESLSKVYNYAVYVKPYAYAASQVADRYTK